MSVEIGGTNRVDAQDKSLHGRYLTSWPLLKIQVTGDWEWRGQLTVQD